jgi:hypothetical protein
MPDRSKAEGLIPAPTADTMREKIAAKMKKEGNTLDEMKPQHM